MDQKKVGKFISMLRKDKKLTQEQLAYKMGVSTNAVSKWERGLSFPDVSLYKKICEELGISIEELINGEKDKSDEAKEKALISVVKSKDMEKRKSKYVIVVSLILIFLLIFFVILFYKKKNDELDRYYERSYQMTFVARNVEAFFKYRYDNKYPDFYGGMYISDDAYNLIVQVVLDKIPPKGTLDFYYYNELFTVDDSIKVEYVKYSYNELENVYNKINEYLFLNDPPKDLNSFYIDIFKNRVVVNYGKVTEKIKEEFRKKIIDSEVVIFESQLDIVDNNNQCLNYPKNIGTDILEEHGNVLISVHVGNKSYVPVVLSLYDDGTYELFTAYESCAPGRFCNSMLKYLMSIKGKYNYDVEKILMASTNADGKSYDMKNLPEYEIYLGEEYIEKYDTLMFTVEKGKSNKYLNELLSLINVDLSKCAKPIYKNDV